MKAAANNWNSRYEYKKTDNQKMSVAESYKQNGAVPTPKDCANHCLLYASEEDLFCYPKLPCGSKVDASETKLYFGIGKSFLNKVVQY